MPDRIQQEDLASIVKLQQEVVTSDLSLDQLMDLICQRTMSLTHSAGAVVEMAESEEMVYRTSCGSLAGSLGLRLNIHASLSGLSVKSAQVLYCEDSETDPRVDKEACRKVGARSMICVPLIHRSTAVGVLKVVDPEPKKFQDREINLLKLIAGLLSACVYKAETEALLRESESRARDATQAKSEFLANMSHEIRTPLNGVVGVTSLLEDTTLNDQQRDYVKLIKSSADNLLTLVNDILDFSKIEARQLTLENVDFELAPAVDDVRQILSHQSRKKDLSLKVTLSPQLPEIVVGDPTRLRQILMNLVGNAIKFTKAGSVEVNVLPDQSEILFEIIDTGIGIPKNALTRMFNPFSQLDASTTRKYGGTGLGLSICRQLVELMGGQIGVSSEEGKGSVFWFRLPLPASQKKILKQDTPVTQNFEKLRILVAEDNSVNQMIVKTMVTKLGHIVHVVSNGKEAVDALNLGTYDLILMDCQMPEMDGYQATRAIRNSGESWANIHIIAMTANAMAGDRENCIRAGMNDYISKPMKKEELLRVIGKSQLKRYKSINRGTIQELKEIDEDGSNTTLKEIIALYLSSTPPKIERMKLHFEKGEVGPLKAEAHSLRSSSMTVGAEELGKIAAKIEYAPAPSADDITRLEEQFARVVDDLRRIT